MKGLKVLSDPNSFQLLADETRRRVIYLLRAKEMTVSQIASDLNLTPQAIYHHIRKMKEADMVEVAREERIDHFIETYYRATAEVFQFSHGEHKQMVRIEEQTKEALGALSKLGFNVEVSDELAKKLIGLGNKMASLTCKQKYVDQAGALEDVDFFAKQGAAEWAELLGMSDKEFEEYCSIHHEMRSVLKSALRTPTKRAKKA
jgi:DNA-binding transcriptional ArsR family regulator